MLLEPRRANQNVLERRFRELTQWPHLQPHLLQLLSRLLFFRSQRVAACHSEHLSPFLPPDP